MHFSEEQVQRAREVSLLDFIRTNEGWTIQKVGNFYTTKEHDSLRILSDEKTFFWNSKGLNGHNVIDWLQKTRNMSFTESVRLILGEDGEKHYVDDSSDHLDKAIEEANLAVNLSETNDCIVYNILANCQRNKMSQLIKQCINGQRYSEVTQEQIDNLENAILDLAEDASDNYSTSRTNGEAPGYICDIQMCIELVDFCRMLHEVEFIDIVPPINS